MSNNKRPNSESFFTRHWKKQSIEYLSIEEMKAIKGGFDLKNSTSDPTAFAVNRWPNGEILISPINVTTDVSILPHLQPKTLGYITREEALSWYREKSPDRNFDWMLPN